MAATATSVTIPVQAVVAGTSGNVAANAITQFVTPGSSGTASNVTNIDPTTGGNTAESTTHLRSRFSSTVFRSLTGTSQMFTGTALANPNVTQVNVLGAVQTYTEQIQVATGKAYSSNTSVRYLYPRTIYLANNTSGTFYTPTLQFTLTSLPVPAPTTTAPTVATTGGHLKAGIYYYAVTTVTKAGETNVQSIIKATVASGTTNKVTVNWTGKTSATVKNLFGITKTVSVTNYRVYRLYNLETPTGGVPSDYYYQRWARLTTVASAVGAMSFVDTGTPAPTTSE
jgi:hypothetical protein